MADGLDESELRESISEILKKGDLASLTSKKIRQILEDKYEVSLKDRKKQIDDIVMSLVDEESDEDDESQSSDRKTSDETNVPSNEKPKEESPAKKQKRSAASERVSVISVANSSKKKVKDKKSSDSDEESSDDNDSKTRKKRQRTKKPKDKTPKSPKKPTGEKRKTGFSMPMVLSPELATLMGETHLARSEVVKRMWQIIRERDLMDPSNKRYTICDDELEKIIGLKRFLTFSMMKYLKRHVKDPSLMVKSSPSPK